MADGVALNDLFGKRLRRVVTLSHLPHLSVADHQMRPLQAFLVLCELPVKSKMAGMFNR
jgi:hypothetical protein